LASAICALSHTLLLLTFARIRQGFGAACVMSINAALVRLIYPRAQFGLGINVMVVAISLGEFAIAALASVLLVQRQTRMASALLPVDLLRIPVLTLSSIAPFAARRWRSPRSPCSSSIASAIRRPGSASW
jgi:MFS family permease